MSNKFGDDPKRIIFLGSGPDGCKFGPHEGQEESAVQPRHPHIALNPLSSMLAVEDFSALPQTPNKFEPSGNEHPIEGIGRFLSEPHIHEDTLVISKDLADRHIEDKSVVFNDMKSTIGTVYCDIPGTEPNAGRMGEDRAVISLSDIDSARTQGDKFPDGECAYVVKDSFIIGSEMQSTIGTKVPSVNKFGEVVPTDGEVMPPMQVSIQIQDLSDVVQAPKPQLPEIKGVHLRGSKVPLGDLGFGEGETPGVNKFLEQWANGLTGENVVKDAVDKFNDLVVGDLTDRLKSGTLRESTRRILLGGDFDGDTDPGQQRYPILGSAQAESNKFGDSDNSEGKVNIQAISRVQRVGQPHIGFMFLMDENGNPIKKDDKFGGW